jgi:hypothetical protein
MDPFFYIKNLVCDATTVILWVFILLTPSSNFRPYSDIPVNAKIVGAAVGIFMIVNGLHIFFRLLYSLHAGAAG